MKDCASMFWKRQSSSQIHNQSSNILNWTYKSCLSPNWKWKRALKRSTMMGNCVGTNGFRQKNPHCAKPKEILRSFLRLRKNFIYQVDFHRQEVYFQNYLHKVDRSDVQLLGIAMYHWIFPSMTAQTGK